MNKTLKNAPDPGVETKNGSKEVGCPSLRCLPVPSRDRGGRREARPGFSGFSPPSFGPSKKERRAGFRGQSRATEQEGPRAQETQAERERRYRARAAGRRPRGVGHADSRVPTHVHTRRVASRAGRRRGRADKSAARPLTPRFPVAEAFGSTARTASSAKQGTDSTGEPSCRSLQEYKTFFSKENVPQLCKGGWQYISNSGLSF